MSTPSKYTPPTPAIPGWMTQEELEWLHDMAAQCDSVAEIGCWKGRSTHALLTGCPGLVYAIDHFQGSKDELETTHAEAAEGNINAEFRANVAHFPHLYMIRGNSLDVAAKFKTDNETLDMVFIDGGHTYEEVVADIRAWKPLATKLLCGHDANFPDVARAIKDELGTIQRGPGSLWFLPIDASRISAPTIEPSLIVCLPGSGWSRKWLECWNGLYSNLLHEYNYRVQVVYASGNNIYEVRCAALETLAGLTPSEHVLWIDYDNLVSMEGFLALRHALTTLLSASAVGAWYLMEPLPGGQPEVTAGFNGRRPTVADIQAGQGQLLEVDYIGFGFLLMKYSLIESLGLRAFNPILRDDGLFETDDGSFCKRAVDAGHRLFLHSGVHTPHLKLMPVPALMGQRSRVAIPTKKERGLLV